MANPVANETSLFLSYYAQEPKAQQDLLDFLRARPEVEQVSSLLPLHEYEIRLGIITQIRDLLRARTGPRDFQFTHIQFCYLIRMPQDELNRALSQATISGITFKELLKDLGELTGYFLQKKGYDDQTTAKGSNTTLSSQPKKRRGKTQVDKCKDLDEGVCIVTGAAHPEVCHIIPFAWNDSLENRRKTSRLTSAMDFFLDLPRATADDMLLTNDSLSRLSNAPGSSDYTWNTLCLSPLLHDWWSRAYFGFKFLGATPIPEKPKPSTSTPLPPKSSVKLQLVWMPRNIQSSLATKDIMLEEEQGPNKRLPTLVTHHHGGSPGTCFTPGCGTCIEVSKVGAHNVKTNRPVWTGSIFHVTRFTTEVSLFQRMIEVQWAIICAAALSGGAQDPDLFLRRDEDDPAQESGLAEEDILEWAQDVQPPSGEHLEEPTT
ncbi:hypothetical protein LRP88_05575 [Fusarium phalaenopsidis]|nr:HNHc domain-containing protein [Fusarium sp. Ph1]